MAAPASNPSHLLISRNPRSPAHPQLASTTTTSLYSPQPGAHLFSFDGSVNSGSTHPYGFMNAHSHGSPDPSNASNVNASSYTVGVASTMTGTTASAPAHMRSHSTPMFPTALDDEDDEDEDEDDIVVHPTFCRDAALPGRVKVVVGRYELWCHKEVLWFASPFFNALLQGW